MAAKIKFAFTPYAKQMEVHNELNDPNGKRFLCLAFGRQAGKSWLARYEALDSAVNRNMAVMWVAPALSTARTHWRQLVKLLKASKIPCQILQASKEIHFPAGGSIVIRSADIPDNLRGDGLGLLILDEAAFFPNGEYVWWSVCLAMITASRGKVLFCSTPKGRNWFYDVFEQGLDPNNEYYKSWQLKSEESPYQDRKLLSFLKKNMPNSRWREEYEAEFLMDGGGVYVGIERASVVTMHDSPRKNAALVAGVDIGVVNDNTCFTVMDKDTREQVYGESFTNTGAIPTIKRLIELLDYWQPEITHIEKNGAGEYAIRLLKEVLKGGNDIQHIIEEMNVGLNADHDEILEEVVGGHRIRAVHMDNPIKRALVERSAADIEFSRLKLLNSQTEYGRKQISEISTFIRKPTKSGNETTYMAKDGCHDDHVIAMYLCYKGMPKPLRVRDVKTNAQKRDVSKMFTSRGKNLHAKRGKLRKST